ncbi:MAG: threonylcarbamoyl-AMP synthase [Spirochaetaceae bacterium]|nr:MAG: threonylcarbamoyl-AMP synthase [Spirochaetaceae bacterium]
MQTHLLTADDIDRVVVLLRNGELVIVPTETVYGLGVRCDREEAVERIFQAKGRPQDNPLIVHVSSIEMADRYAFVDRIAEKLFTRFAPGPLTLVLPARDTVAANVRAGLPTVAIRIPGHPVTRRIIELSDVGIAAPSANKSGRPSPTTAFSALSEMNGRVRAVLDGGPCQLGIESTVVVVEQGMPRILRPGRITIEEICECLSCPNPLHQSQSAVETAVSVNEAAVSPGTRHMHYKPDAEVIAIDSVSSLGSIGIDSERDCMFCMEGKFAAEFLRCGGAEAGLRYATDVQAYEYNLYEWLFQAERSGYTRIFVELPPESPATQGLRDRIFRASGSV